MQVVVDKLISFTETVLTFRKKSKYIKSEREKNLHPVADWLGAFLWAAGVVLLLNQFLFQAYVIPSKSMERTLRTRDRLFVNKFLYGPELLPGKFKIDGSIEPKLSDVVIFENPEYISKGALFDLAQRVIFMLSLSMIDIDKDANGNPAHHFLIKRIAASNGDFIKFIRGELYIKPEGESSYFHEKDYMALTGRDYYYQRTIISENYPVVDRSTRQTVFYETLGYGSVLTSRPKFQLDSVESNIIINKYLSQVSPSNLGFYQEFKENKIGVYVPKGWYLPLGDNRDRSHDGRIFGSIEDREILGRASFKFWPLNRLRKVR